MRILGVTRKLFSDDSKIEGGIGMAPMSSEGGEDLLIEKLYESSLISEKSFATLLL